MEKFAAIAIAVALGAASLAPTSALADPIGVTLQDAAECLPGSTYCPPDIQSATGVFDPATGFLDASVTFYGALPTQTTPPYTAAPVPHDGLRIVFGHTITNGHCGYIESGGAYDPGDLILIGWAIGQANTTEWTRADLSIAGYSGTAQVPRALSADARTLEYAVTNPALVGSTIKCFEVLENLAGGPVPEDGTPFAWFPGAGPAAEPPVGTTPAPPVTFPITPAPPVVVELPKNFTPPELTGKLRRGSLLRCSKGLWDMPVMVAAYHWFRGSTRIASASHSTYRPGIQDVGRSLRCGVLIRYDDGRSVSKKSAAVIVKRAAKKRA